MFCPDLHTPQRPVTSPRDVVKTKVAQDALKAAPATKESLSSRKITLPNFCLVLYLAQVINQFLG